MLFLLKNSWMQKVFALLILKIVLFTIVYYFCYKDFKIKTSKEMVLERILSN